MICIVNHQPRYMIYTWSINTILLCLCKQCFFLYTKSCGTQPWFPVGASRKMMLSLDENIWACSLFHIHVNLWLFTRRSYVRFIHTLVGPHVWLQKNPHNGPMEAARSRQQRNATPRDVLIARVSLSHTTHGCPTLHAIWRMATNKRLDKEATSLGDMLYSYLYIYT